MSEQTATNAQRDALIDRCRKLAQMTIANGCSEAEASFAARKLAEMMAEHDIGQTEFSVRRDAAQCAIDGATAIGDGYLDYGVAIGAIAKLFHCRVWYHRQTSDVLGLGIKTVTTTINFFGFPADTAAAHAMLEIVASAVNSSSIAFRKELGRQGAHNRKGDMRVQSFRIGMGEHLAQRIMELIAPPKATGTALVVLKDQLVTEEWAKQNIHLDNAPRRSAADAASYAEGQSRADGVRLGANAEVGGTRQIGSR